jgi:leukotriene-A4 hydrolase
MSAKELEPTKNSDGTTTYHFNQDLPIPSYLLAMAVGNLAVKQVGKRTSIIAEPGEKFLDYYAKELEDLEDLLIRTETFLTPYSWGPYSILVLPPSFPFGGMENPLLTFASPTIIVGDKSQIFVATHEIAHSWTGNLVTGKDWSSLWLNEGFTTFEERKVSEQIHGRDFAMIASTLGNVSLWSDMQAFGLDHSFSALHPQLEGADPDDSFSTVCYEKGYQFIVYMESLFKSKEDFQKFLQSYLVKYDKKSVSYIDLKDTLESWVRANYEADFAEDLIKKIDW